MLSGSMIPGFIHQMWIDPSEAGDRPVPAGIAENLGIWRVLNPHYVHRLWGLGDVLDLCAVRGRSDVATSIRQCRFPAMQTDLARLFLLSTFGGFWSDLKLRPRLPIPTGLHCHEAVVVEHFPKVDLPAPDGLLCNGFMGAVPGSTLMATALALAMKNVVQQKGDSAFTITGPGALTLAWKIYRLSEPARARAVHMIPHAAAWGVLWDVGPDTYNVPGMHWTVRQRRESPFISPLAAEPQVSPRVGLFEAVPGHVTRIDAIYSKQGFHPFEEPGGFCWLAEGPPSRIFFDAFLPFDGLCLKLFAVPRYPVPAVAFVLNGTRVSSDVRREGERWTMVELGPFPVRRRWNELVIAPPGFAAAPTESNGQDSRRLSIALAWAQPRLCN